MQPSETGTTRSILANPRSSSLTPYSPVLIETLQNLIAPGGRARLSPFVESAQFDVLFGERPEPKRRHEHARQILAKHKTQITRLAHCWSDFAQNKAKKFSAEVYDEEFLRAYLAYYLTVNVCKIQLTMLEMVRQRKLHGKHTIVDVGVGAGTTAVAIIDFAIAWSSVCDLYSVKFPILDLQFIGYDCNPSCLDFAERTCLAYSASLIERQVSTGQVQDNNTLAQAMKWAQEASWRVADIADAPLVNLADRTILIASNVLNELGQQGKSNLQQTVANLPAKSLALVIEPGENVKTQVLNQWRHELLANHRDVAALAPCIEDDPAEFVSPCCQCWNARRESLQQPILYKEFRAEVVKIVTDHRRVNDFENDLLSWSYTWLQRGCEKRVCEPTANQKTNELRTRYLGIFAQQKDYPVVGQTRYCVLSHEPDLSESHPQHNWVRYMKLCPVGQGKGYHGVVLEKHPGFLLPALRHGQLIRLENVRFQASWSGRSGILAIIPNGETQIALEEERADRNDAFLADYSSATRQAVDDIAYRLFGFPRMRDFQHDILRHALTGRSILGIAATGGGKSECFILPAMLLPGITVVISPLKSLMQDQYDQRICERYGLNNLTTYINGDIRFQNRQARLKRLELGYYKLIYLTPEQLERGYVLDSLKRAHDNVGIRYLALDEAHCISQWGHDFRPSYLNIVRRLRRWGIQPVRIALTATASPKVRSDLCEELELSPSPVSEGGDVYIYSSNRPELNLVVRVKATTAEKVAGIEDDLRRLLRDNMDNQQPGAAIVFLPKTGGNPDELWQYWPQGSLPLRGRQSAGVTPFASYLERSLQERVAIYHGKMNTDDATIDIDAPKEFGVELSAGEVIEQPEFGDLSRRSRRREQDAFISGERDIMVATKGFGMGIDKPNIRLVIHRTPPGNLESYAQEAGRAGRDGDIATVVLYYSPDRASDTDNSVVQSDHEIQSYFLQSRYIRREDVAIMRAFLRQVERWAGKYLYFTNDEAIAFYDRCTATGWQELGLPISFTWPKFEPRQRRNQEPPEHTAILDRGHLYSAKTQYVSRVLQVLYKIRPPVNGEDHVAFLHEFQTTGIKLQGLTIKNADHLLSSNAYFGRLLRDHHFDLHKLIHLAERCTSHDVFELAQILDLAPSEVVAMFNDMRSADGFFDQRGTWKPALVDFSRVVAPRYGPAAGKDTAEEWLDYAGAQGRAGSRLWGSLETAFPKNKWSQSVGWEVLPGPAFFYDDQFTEYLDAFMSLHDARAQNDWSAYERLLTDYVGVDDNGHLRPRQEQRCLRSVLLGYLETNEIVDGDNCGSCSRCVPNGQFEPSLDKRRQVVISLSSDIKQILDNIKVEPDRLPTPDSSDRLWLLVEREEQAGRAVMGYISGWTNRQLSDTPGHLGALWVRATGMLRQHIPLQTKELLDGARHLMSKCNGIELQRLVELMVSAHDLMPQAAEPRVLQANLYHRLQQYENELEMWEEVLAVGAENTAIRHEAYMSLVALFAPAGALSDVGEYKKYSVLAARTAQDVDSAIKLYSVILLGWAWPDLEQELVFLHKLPTPESLERALIEAWLEPARSLDDIAAVLVFLSQHNQYAAWPTSRIGNLMECMPVHLLARVPQVVYWYLVKEAAADYPSSAAQFVHLALPVLTGELPLDVNDDVRLVFATLTAEQLSDQEADDLVFKYGNRQQLWNAAFGTYSPKQSQVAMRLVGWFGEDLVADDQLGSLLDDVRLVAKSLASSTYLSANSEVAAYLCDELELLFRRPKLRCEAYGLWITIMTHLPKGTEAYTILESKAQSVDAVSAEQCLDGLLSNNSGNLIAQMVRAYYALSLSTPNGRVSSAVEMISLLEQLTQTSDFAQVERIEHYHFDEILQVFKPELSVNRADMAAAVLHYLYEHITKKWQTPRKQLVKVLGYAGRYAEARDLVNECNQPLFVDTGKQKLLAETFLRQCKAPERNPPTNVEDYRLIVESVLGEWRLLKSN